MENRIIENGITYRLVGDYYIPELEIPDEEHVIGKYGRMRREYLKKHHPGRYNAIVMRGTLWKYLADLNEQAQERLQLIMKQMQEAEGVIENKRMENYWERVRWLESIYKRAEEIILYEFVYIR